MEHMLATHNSLLNQFIAELRDASIQRDSMRFRRNMERAGEIFAYEISKSFEYRTKSVSTPLGIAEVNVPAETPVLATILRAGLPFHQGFLNYFDNAQNAFISAYRKAHKDGHFDIEIEYISTPDLTDKLLILVDPMLATGSSMVLAYKNLLTRGKPRHTHIASVLASAEGVNYVKAHLPSNVTLWVGQIDAELTAQSFIVPGLGDAGDLAFGAKK